MGRKCICLLLSMGVVLLSAPQVLAGEQRGNLQVVPIWCGKAVEGGTVTLSRIGTETEGGIQVTDGLANWILEEEDILTGNWSIWIQEESSQEKPVVFETGAEFLELEEGVYLIHQTKPREGYACFRPFLLRVPENGSWNLIKRPSLVSLEPPPDTGDRPAPIIGAMGIGFSVAALMVLADSRKK